MLATLPPRERVRIAMRLGIRLCRERGYLDPHAEAWRVLATPGKGILARAAGGVDALKGLKATVRRANEDDTSPDASLDADAGASVIGSVLRRIGRDIAEAAGAVRPDAARANWLETLASVLTAGAETGSCPASDPREICALPAVAGGRVGALKILKTPRALVVARYEEATLGAVAGAQRARLTPAQRLAVDALATHPQRRVLETRLKRSGSDYKRMADAAVLSAFAASPWASFGHIGDVPLEADEAESVAADVYGCLLDGRAPTGPTGRNKAKKKTLGRARRKGRRKRHGRRRRAVAARVARVRGRDDARGLARAARVLRVQRERRDVPTGRLRRVTRNQTSRVGSERTRGFVRAHRGVAGTRRVARVAWSAHR